MLSHTFVVTAFKDSAYLEDCIESLVAQKAGSELIITTSTPSEFTAQLAEKYGLKYFVNEVRESGIANDWNFALRAAQTDLVTIVHQDDIYKVDYRSHILNAFKESKGKTLIVFSNYEEIQNAHVRESTLNFIIKKMLLFPFFLSSSISSIILKKFILSFGDPICCPSVTFNKSMIEGFEFSSDFKCALDWYAWYELAKRDGAFLFVDKKLVQHRIHHESATTAYLQTGVRMEEEKRILKMIWGDAIGGLIARIYSLGHKSNRTT